MLTNGFGKFKSAKHTYSWTAVYDNNNNNNNGI